MSISYENVVKFYEDKEDDYLCNVNKDEPYLKVARSVRFATDNNKGTFEDYIEQGKKEGHNRDDLIFAWYLINHKKKIDGAEWRTAELYGEGLFEWLKSACKKEFIGQKWHLFQYVLYGEMNGEYNFSEALKIKNMEDPFRYYSSSRAKSPELIFWMAKQAGYSYTNEEKEEICKKIKEYSSWTAIKEKMEEQLTNA